MTIAYIDDPIYRAISSLCDLKGAVTYSEIASVANVKRQNVIDCILRNKHLLKMDKKGKVTGFISHKANVHRMVEQMFVSGKVYKTNEVNYGCDKAIEVYESHKEKVKHLIKPYCVGGIGDNYWTEYIIVTEGTCKAMKELGFCDYDDVVKEKIDKGENKVWNDWCK
jgi:hypothetical protein